MKHTSRRCAAAVPLRVLALCSAIGCGDSSVHNTDAVSAVPRDKSRPPDAPVDQPPAPAPTAVPRVDSGPVQARACDADGRCWSQQEAHDVGLLCLSERSRQAAGSARIHYLHTREPLRLTVGSRPYVLIDPEPCLSSSCSRRVEHACSLESHDRQHVVTTSYRYEHTESGSCTEDCYRETASCRLPSLRKGIHTLRFGAHTLTFEVPGELPEPCRGGEPLQARPRPTGP